MPKEEKETIDHFRAAGKRFAVLSDLWPRPSILKQPCPTGLPSSAPWHPERCENDAAWEVGNVAEVYHIVPKNLHVDVEGSAFFSKEVRMNSYLFKTFVSQHPAVHSWSRKGTNLCYRQYSEECLSHLLPRFHHPCFLLRERI